MDDDFRELYADELARVDAAIAALDDALRALNSIQDDYNIPEPEWMPAVKAWIENTTAELND